MRTGILRAEAELWGEASFRLTEQASSQAQRGSCGSKTLEQDGSSDIRVRALRCCRRGIKFHTKQSSNPVCTVLNDTHPEIKIHTNSYYKIWVTLQLSNKVSYWLSWASTDWLAPFKHVSGQEWARSIDLALVIWIRKCINVVYSLSAGIRKHLVRKNNNTQRFEKLFLLPAGNFDTWCIDFSRI